MDLVRRITRNGVGVVESRIADAQLGVRLKDDYQEVEINGRTVRRWRNESRRTRSDIHQDESDSGQSG